MSTIFVKPIMFIYSPFKPPVDSKKYLNTNLKKKISILLDQDLPFCSKSILVIFLLENQSWILFGVQGMHPLLDWLMDHNLVASFWISFFLYFLLVFLLQSFKRLNNYINLINAIYLVNILQKLSILASLFLSIFLAWTVSLLQ